VTLFVKPWPAVNVTTPPESVTVAACAEAGIARESTINTRTRRTIHVRG
jgi:hypothetical protein